MKTIDEFLTSLSQQDVKLWLENDRLCCDAPEEVLTSSLSSQLAERKQEIIAFLNRVDLATKSRQTITPVARTENIPLSFAQQRLWFLDQMEPGNPLYNLAGAVRLEGSLDIAAFEQSFNEIVRRHESLRTTFKTIDGQAVQEIAPNLKLALPILDWRQLEQKEQETEVLRLTEDEAQRPFDLATEPLIRTTLVRLANAEYVALLTMHHIVSDAWSMGVFVRELSTLYEAFSTGQPSLLPELSIQYPDFAARQRQWLQGEVLETQLSYWRKQLGGSLPVLQLPTDHPRPKAQTFRGAKYSFSLDSELTEALKELGQQEEVTLFMTLLAAFKTLLYRYTFQEDILVGSPIANRNRTETEQLIGFFVNTLVLRADLSGNPTFRELLGRIRQITWDAYDHQDLPFEKLVEELQPERDLSYSPLFQVKFMLQNAPQSELKLSDITLSFLDSKTRTAKLDLSLDMYETDSRLVGNFEYNTDLFDETTIARMADHFGSLLSGIIANPEQPISQLPLLTPAERKQILFEWNNTQTEYPQNLCFHQLFEEQAKETPDAVAVVFQEQKLTYEELNQRANQLAHYLQKLGVKPECKVGLCVERSPEMIIGMLGILKAGGAYLPLDPTYPQERLDFMLSDSQVNILLTTQKLKSQLFQLPGQIVCLDKDEFAQENSSNTDSKVTVDNLAYLIYTSGSTGTPKGVLVTHEGLVNLTQDKIRTCKVRANSRILQFFSFSFDASIPEIVMALGSGAALYLGTATNVLPGQALLEFLRQHAITHITITPSALTVLPPAELPDLEMVLVGGEAPSPELISQWSQGRLFINAYGPTETTVNASMVECGNGEDLLPTVRPAANKQLYILDPNLQLVPIGVPGELHIAGVGLARGYLDRPVKTATTFIPNPFRDRPGARLYKTGDLACYLKGGRIQLLGRIDHQVKIRGFRIELKEIETVLNTHPQIHQVVVIARDDISGNKSLVAYIVIQEETLSSGQLRQFLEQKLPAYMLPNIFVTLDTLPLTPNNKVDLKALPAPDNARPELDKAFVASRTPVETKLVEIWSQVLGLEQIGIDDNFFEIGGDSILMIQIVARANQAGLQITPKQLFEHQNIAGLAAVATIANTKEPLLAEQGLVTGKVFLTPIQKWFFEQNLSKRHHYNQAVLLEVQQQIDLDLLEQALQQLLLHHDALRLKFESTESGWQQVHQSSADVSLQLNRWDFSALTEAEQKQAIETTANELQASFNLATGSLLRVGFFDLGASKSSRLLIVIHHLVVDGVSWRILLEDLQTAYQQLSQKEPVVLPAKTTSFQQWSQKLREYGGSTALKQELDYWQSQLLKPSNPLPVNFAEGDNTMASVQSISSHLSTQETQALLQEVPQIYNTQINDVLLTALVQAFARWTGESTLLVNLEGHGREDIADEVNLSRTVGWFTTVFPVLLSLEDTFDLGDALKKVKEQLRSIPNRGIGYGVLRYLSEEPKVTEELKSLPQAEVVFNYLGQFDQSLSPSSLFGLAPESSGLASSPKNKRSHLLEINGMVNQGQLQIKWSYSQNLHDRTTIEALAQYYVEALRSLIAHCQSPDAGGFTPSDFPLAQLKQEELDAALGMVNFENENIEAVYPLSPLQQVMLFHSFDKPASGVYVNQTSWDFYGELNLSAFVRAWQQVMDRHPVLRTAFVWGNLKEPLQIVSRYVKLDWSEQDWQNVPHAQQQKRLENLLDTDRKRGFELSEAPLMRIVAIKLAESHCHFVWSHHHLLTDGWSVPIIFQEVITYYKEFYQGKIPELNLPYPYQNYIAWLEQQDMSQAEEFWREELKGFTVPTTLKVDQASSESSDKNKNYDEREIKLSTEVTTALKSFAQRQHLTLNTLIQGAWALLLNRYTTRKDVVFGAVVSGRPSALPNVESMVGLFINALPVRVQVTPDQFLLSWLKHIQAQSLEIRQYEYSPLVDIQEWSEIPRELPLFESLIFFENYPVDSSLQSQIPDLEIGNMRVFEQTHYPLNLFVITDRELALKIVYNCHRFDPATITRMLDPLQTLLKSIVANPEVRLSDLSMLTEAERHQQILETISAPVEISEEEEREEIEI
ncbi:Non-ribosomal peptide synthase [Hyella patelloides LEGE 07179]|uniref:Non-ribosomal peptide synthase n=1 Tax=Hyella patelloides LEGE 07179 TaxID=945734 RepID=A0A563W4X2_9CYAN|nr:non-ribosomal peptide synthetase [Hyella patelloides]VEP18728.1 Non-ribosomal peptide synthase [Hyella patelloides LEGE 07179]